MTKENDTSSCDSGNCGTDFLGGLFNLMDKIEEKKEKQKAENEK